MTALLSIFDVTLIASGAAGGLVKACFDKSTAMDSVRTIIMGALTSNFTSVPFVSLAASGLLFGLKMEPNLGMTAFFDGAFAAILIDIIGKKLRTKFGDQ